MAISRKNLPAVLMRRLHWPAGLAMAAVMLLGPPSSAAQDLEIHEHALVLEGAFGESGDGGLVSSSESRVTAQGTGPGLVVLTSHATTTYDAGMLQMIANATPAGPAAGAALSVFTRLEFDSNLSLSGGNTGTSEYQPEKRVCFGLFGTVVEMINSFNPTELDSWRERWAELTGNPLAPLNIECPLTDSRVYSDVPAGTFQAKFELDAEVHTAVTVRVSVSGAGVGVAPEAELDQILGRSARHEKLGTIVFGCTPGLKWSDLENQCVCDTQQFPPHKNPIAECASSICGSNEVRDHDGNCVACPIGYEAVGDRCIPLHPDLSDCSDYPAGSAEYCALCPDTLDCLHCTSHGFAGILCRSRYEFTYMNGDPETPFGCLWDSRTCTWYQYFKTYPPGAPEPPRDFLTACSEGLGWSRCPDGNPNVRELLPEEDLLDLFPPCFFASDGTQITACGDGFPGGTDLPDLVLRSAEVVTAHPVAGVPLAFRFTVANHGTEPAPNSEWHAYVGWPGDGRSLTGLTGSLAPGEARTVTVTSEQLMFPTLNTVYTAWLTADRTDTVAELNENNNEQVLTVEVIEGAGSVGGPDLVASAVGVVPVQPAPGTAAEFSVIVRNDGDQTAPPSVYGLVLLGPDGWLSPAEGEVPALAPGASHALTLAFNEDQPGPYIMTFIADATAAIAEVSEGNNKVKQQLTVQAPDPCLPCTSGAPNNQVGAAQCFASPEGVAHEGDLFRCAGVRGDGTTCAPGGNQPNGWFAESPRCPDPTSLCSHRLHPDRCGVAEVCPGTQFCLF